jgi:hypothetical protein
VSALSFHWIVMIEGACRVLLATIRDKGICPCPRCLTPKSQFHRLGFISDFMARLQNIRTYMEQAVLSARNLIYMHGIPVKGAKVERLLKQFSLVPTPVSNLVSVTYILFTFHSRMPLLSGFHLSDLCFSQTSLLTRCMNLSLDY